MNLFIYHKKKMTPTILSDSKSCTSMVPVKEDMLSSDSKIYSFMTTMIQNELHCLHEETKQEEKDSLVNQEVSLNETASTRTGDDDEHSQGSFSTLLSKSFSEDDSSFESTSTDLEQLEKEFARRDKLLKKLVKGIDPVYALAMRENEQAVRQLKLKQLQKDEKQQKQSTQHPIDANTDEFDVRKGGQIGSLESVRRAFAFEAQNTLPGVIIVVLNCIAYGCCCQAAVQVINAITDVYHNPELVSVIIILFSVVLLRFTGGLWEYVGSEAYERVKFDTHNRLRLGKMDAVIMQWFHKNPNMYTFANAFAFFACCESVVWLHERCLAVIDQRYVIFQSLPSVKQGIMTTAAEKIAEGLELETVRRHVANASCDAREALHADLTNQDYAYLQSVLSTLSYQDFFGLEATVFVGEWTMIGYCVASLFLSIFVLGRMGHKFWAHER